MRLGTWKRLGIFALVGLFLSLIISCSPGSNTGSRADGRTQIEFWTMQLQPKFTDYFNDLIQEFEADHPSVAVRWVDVPWGAMESRILTAVSAHTATDVVNLNPDFASQLAGREAWLPLDDRVSPEVKAQYLPKIWQANTLNDQTFGVPWYLTSRIAIYNQALFEQAGLSTPPQTYEALAVAARAIKERTGNYAFFVTAVPEDSGEVMESMVQMGVTLVDDQGAAAFDTPEGRAAFQYWVDLYQQNLIPPQVLTEGHRHAVELYQSGQTALLSSSPEFLNTIATNAPDIAQVSAAAPQLTGSTGKKNVAVMNLVIPKDTAHPDEALDFALFVTNPENQLAFAKAANVLPSTQGSLEDPYFSTVDENASSADKARVVSASQMQAAEVLAPAVIDVKQLQKILYENLQAAMLGQKTVDQAVTDAATAWNATQA